jgi:hypothetical protein
LKSLRACVSAGRFARRHAQLREATGIEIIDGIG